MSDVYKIRRLFVVLFVFATSIVGVLVTISDSSGVQGQKTAVSSSRDGDLAMVAIDKLLVSQDDYRTDYVRDYFGKNWGEIKGCDTRDVILYRDMINTTVNDKCQVTNGDLLDPYSGTIMHFVRGKSTSSLVQIDHVVALSDAWKKGAQDMDNATRLAFANDPLELLAVSGIENQRKSGYDASRWLPSNVAYRCTYIARQIAVKIKYKLWVSPNEKLTMKSLLSGCSSQVLPVK